MGSGVESDELFYKLKIAYSEFIIQHLFSLKVLIGYEGTGRVIAAAGQPSSEAQGRCDTHAELPHRRQML